MNKCAESILELNEKVDKDFRLVYLDIAWGSEKSGLWSYGPSEVEQLIVMLHDLSLCHQIVCVKSSRGPGSSISLDILTSKDGQTNIDADVIEACRVFLNGK